MIARLNLHLTSARRSLCESVGISRYSRPARFDLENKLAEYLPKKGTFFEAGAFDGYGESNTYYLEKIKGWTGVLVEPISGNFNAARHTRTRSQVFRAALVPPSLSGELIKIDSAGPMSISLQDGVPHEENDMKLRRTGAGVSNTEIEHVKGMTIDEVLSEAGISEIDFFSLDIEGAETAALEGFSLDQIRPKFFLIECLTDKAETDIRAVLGNSGYRHIDKLTPHDHLFSPR